MTVLDERFQKGIETRTRMGGGTPSAGSVPVSRELAPDLHRILGEALFGSIWHRPALTFVHKEMSTLSVLTALQRENQLRQHTGNALNQGLTPEQIIEIFIHLAFYVGVPAAFNAMGIARAVFDQRRITCTPQLVYNPADDPETLHQQGVAKRHELMGDQPPGSLAGPMTNAERELNRLTSEYLWGAVWTRPGLDLKSRSLCTLSALTALGQERQLRSHVRGALRIGYGQEEIVEIFVHTVFYAGLPAARTAIDIANEVFRNG
jgi:alkylhydroperoxidase/carboxymuconolactone decarboxylase family protein YurZ